MTRSFTASPVRTAGLAILAGLMAYLASLIPPEGSTRAWMGHWLGMAVFALCAALGLGQTFFPVIFEITPEGFACKGGLSGGYAVPWRDVESFALSQVSAGTVVWTFRPGVRPSNVLLRLVVRLGRQPALPTTLPLTSQALLDLMTEALNQSRT